MALDQSKLQTELETWMTTLVTSKSDGINNFADAYETYAIDATATSGGSYVSANKALMISTLTTGLPDEGTVVNAVTVFADAISKFWSGAVLTPSIVTDFSVCNAALLISLAPIFADISPDTSVETKANQLAIAIHAATILVITYNSGTSTPGVLA